MGQRGAEANSWLERTRHAEPGTHGSTSTAGLPVWLLLFLATILIAPSSPESRLPKEPFDLALLLFNSIPWSVALMPSSELG